MRALKITRAGKNVGHSGKKIVPRHKTQEGIYSFSVSPPYNHIVALTVPEGFRWEAY